MKREQRVVAMKGQIGVTLIEVLVALLVLGIGLLAVAALQASSIRSTYTSMERTMALLQIENFSELIRTNAQRARSGDFVVDECEAMAGLGIQEWINDVQAATHSDICPEVTWDGEVYVITIDWANERDGSTNQFTTMVMP